MNPLRWALATTAGAIISFTSLALLPLVGYDTTTATWLAYLGLAAGLTSTATAVFTVAALQPPTGPQETAQERLRLSVVREQLPTAKRPTMGAIELPAAR